METLKRVSPKIIQMDSFLYLLLSVFILSSTALYAQNSSLEIYGQPPFVTAFDRQYQGAIGAIEAGDAKAAMDLLEAARKEAADRKDSANKSKARDALRRVKSFYAPFYDHLAEGDELMQQRSWKAGQEQYEAALQLLGKYRETDLKELESVDRELASQVEEEVRKADLQRTMLVQEHFRVAEQNLFGGNYDIVLAEMEEARSLLFEEREARELERVQALEDRARYQQLMEAGHKAADNEDFRAALIAYQEAQEFIDSYEVQEKQKEMKSRLHYELLRQGQEAYLGGRYEDAADILSEAASIQDSPYHQRIIQNAYSDLKAKGDAALEKKRHVEAEMWYRRAQLFADGPEIRESVSRARSTSAYEKKFARALSSIEEEKLARARRQLRGAIRETPTEEARQLIADIDTYFEKIQSGKHLLNGAPAQAWQRFMEARKLFATDEIEQWMNKARQAAGGQVGEIDPNIFYN